jgi:hypothetical protein
MNSKGKFFLKLLKKILLKPPKSVPQKKIFAENTEIADAIYGTG